MGILKSYNYSEFSGGVDLSKINTEISEKKCITDFVCVLMDDQVHVIGGTIDSETDLDACISDHPTGEDNPEAEMLKRKRKLARLLRTMERNPLIDQTTGNQLLRAESNYVEEYKYSADGYTDLMAQLTARANDTGDTYYTFLNGPTADPDNGVTVLLGIGGILA